jgi:opacity protein-like surface antigen
MGRESMYSMLLNRTLSEDARVHPVKERCGSCCRRLGVHSSMRTIFTALFCFMLCATHAAAQSPIPAATSRTIDVSLGYSYISRGDSHSNRVGLNGADASFTIGVHSRLAIRADLGYAWANNVGGLARRSDVLSYLAGPVFYPTTHRHVDTYVHALVGAARVTGPILLIGRLFMDGAWTNQFAWGVGAGAEYWVSDSMAIRTGVDYLRTAYFDPSLVIRGQNNLRTTAAVVYFFGKHSRVRR